MTLFSSPPLTAAAIAVILLHIVPRILKGKAAFIAEIVNIALHIGLICAMFFLHIPYREVVVVFMLSVFVFVLLYFIFERAKGERGDKQNDV